MNQIVYAFFLRIEYVQQSGGGDGFAATGEVEFIGNAHFAGVAVLRQASIAVRINAFLRTFYWNHELITDTFAIQSFGDGFYQIIGIEGCVVGAYLYRFVTGRSHYE